MAEQHLSDVVADTLKQEQRHLNTPAPADADKLWSNKMRGQRK
jgi:hypothetical protein